MPAGFQQARRASNSFLRAKSGQLAKSRINPFDSAVMVGDDNGIVGGGQSTDLHIHPLLGAFGFSNVLDDAYDSRHLPLLIQHQFAQTAHPAHFVVVQTNDPVNAVERLAVFQYVVAQVMLHFTAVLRVNNLGPSLFIMRHILIPQAKYFIQNLRAAPQAGSHVISVRTQAGNTLRFQKLVGRLPKYVHDVLPVGDVPERGQFRPPTLIRNNIGGDFGKAMRWPPFFRCQHSGTKWLPGSAGFCVFSGSSETASNVMCKNSSRV